MSLLREIQNAVFKDEPSLAPVFLKLRLLAARLGSQPLADWVLYESGGYPEHVPVPDYRVIQTAYKATFSGPLGSRLADVPIPPQLVEVLAGETWTKRPVRESVAAVDELFAACSEEGAITIDASALIPVLRKIVTPGVQCVSVIGILPRPALANLRHSVRSRVLELTIQLEQAVPEAASIAMEGGASSLPEAPGTEILRIVEQTIYGDVIAVNARGDASVNITVGHDDLPSLVEFLTKNGIAEEDAKELADLMKSEQPVSDREPLGRKAAAWLADNLKKAVNGTWQVGVTVATELIKEGALKYYHLK